MMTLRNPQKNNRFDLEMSLSTFPHVFPSYNGQIADALPMCRLNIIHLGYHFYYLNPSTTQQELCTLALQSPSLCFTPCLVNTSSLPLLHPNFSPWYDWKVLRKGIPKWTALFWRLSSNGDWKEKLTELTLPGTSPIISMKTRDQNLLSRLKHP